MNINTKLIKSFLLFLICLFIFIPLGCSGRNEINESNIFINSEIEDLMAGADELSGTMDDIIGISLSNGNASTDEGLVYMEDERDLLHLLFSSKMSEDSEYILKIFVDYQEAEFYIDQNKYNKYIFSAKADDGFDIPFQLCEGQLDLDMSHIVTIAIFQNPEKKTFKEDFLTRSNCADFEVAKKGQTRKIEKHTETSTDDMYLDITYSGIMLNQDYDFVPANEVFFPSKSIYANAGEIVSLAFRAGNFTHTDDALFVLMVDWGQVEIGGSIYRHITNIEGKVTCGTIDFYAPKEPGEYEVISFISAHPYELRDSSNFNLNDISTRFTLIVE